MLGVRQRDEVLVVDQFVFYCLPVLVTSSFSLEGYVFVTDWHPMPGGGVFPHVSYIGLCYWTGYGFLPSLS